MQQSNSDGYNTHIHYTPHYKNSVGLKLLKNEHGKGQFLQHNYLAVRVNKRHSQANLYLKQGIGAFEDKPAVFYGAAADWETRRCFTSYAIESLDVHGQQQGDYTKQQARIGIAPYIAEYGGFHTWLMLQHTKDSGSAIKNESAVVARFFSGPHLLEIEYSENNNTQLNYIHRF